MTRGELVLHGNVSVFSIESFGGDQGVRFGAPILDDVGIDAFVDVSCVGDGWCHAGEDEQGCGAQHIVLDRDLGRFEYKYDLSG